MILLQCAPWHALNEINFASAISALLLAFWLYSLGPSLCLYALNLGEDNSIVLG